MDRKTKRSVAVVAGLTAVLALSPVAGPLTTALADEGTDSAVSVQSFGHVERNHEFVDRHINYLPWLCSPDGYCDDCCQKADAPCHQVKVTFVTVDGATYDTTVGFGKSISAAIESLDVSQSVKDEFKASEWTYDKAGCTPAELDDPLNGSPHYTFWQVASDVSVSFKMNYPEGATGTGSDYFVTTEKGGYIDAPTDPTCEGYEFLGWALNGKTNIPLLTSRAAGLATYSEDTYYVAQWKLLEGEDEDVQTVKFVAFNPETGNQDLNYSVPNLGQTSAVVVWEIPNAPSYDGFEFTGWLCTEGSLKGELFQSSDLLSQAVPVDCVFTAQYKAIDQEKPGGDTEKPDTENPGTDTEQPGTDTEQPGTDTETPGTDTEQPGTGTETPDADDNADVVTPNDNADASDDTADATDKSDDASKKADETTNEDKSADEDALPSTGDASVAVSGIAALGTAVAGLGAFLRRRR